MNNMIKDKIIRLKIKIKYINNIIKKNILS